MLTSLFSKSVQVLELDGDHLRIIRIGHVESRPVQSIVNAPEVRRGIFGTLLKISSDKNEDIIFRGASSSGARKFSDALKDAWVRANLSALENGTGRLESILERIRMLASPTHYPAACRVSSLLYDARSLDVSLLSRLRPEAIGAEATARIDVVRKFVSDPRTARENSITLFVNAELDQWKDFFDTIERKPLTPEQRLSVVVDEDATLVLAGAGSGKTSVITAKAAYLVKAGVRKPNEILMLAFARNAAAEMSERIEARSGVPIAAQTFHGLAYSIIGIVEGSKPALADHASDEMAFNNLIKQILKDLVDQLSNVSWAIIRWFAHFLVEPKTEWDFKTKSEFYSHMKRQDLRTLQGERVKSYEELQIANWLYENGIEYEYEPVYQHNVSAGSKRDYQPDFRLKESGVYIEHFGVRRRKLSDGREELFTAPFVDRDSYLESMEWKRDIHAKYGTILIETYSYERQEGRLLTSLAEKLEPYSKLMPLAPDTIYDRIIELKLVDDVSKLVGTFLRKFKSGAYRLEDCEAKSQRMNLGQRGKAFLDIFVPVFDEYQKRLSGRIDFEDMILRAARHVETGCYVSPFRHILVDEFQDISQSRARLLRALKAQHQDARIFAVGDDWQSIFRFAGSDIHLMRHFGREFGGSFDGEAGVHRTIDLGRTFRSVDQIASAARAFVLKNPDQIEKQVVPAGIATKPAIRIVSLSKGEYEQMLFDVLSQLSADPAYDAKPATVLLLARYRHVEPNMRELQRQFSQLEINFKTIHASKGLEADHVVLLNADSGRSGFPSEIVDDPLLSLVSPEEEIFSNAEERRVMYVAMTRARHTLTILASKKWPSSFVTELRTDPAYGISSRSEAHTDSQICGECGGYLLGVTGQDGRNWYRCEHVGYCENFLPACASCGVSLPRRAAESTELTCSCAARYPACPECEDGWLVERAGTYGHFLGCVRFPRCKGIARSSLKRRGSRNVKRKC